MPKVTKEQVIRNLITAAIVVGGAGLLQTLVVDKVGFLSFLNTLPSFFGISLGAIALGTVALIGYEYFKKK